MKLQQLRYFQAACKYNSITLAAEALYVSQPSISMAIRDLEKYFGVPLLNRQYRSFTLTPEGAELAKMADALLHYSDSIEKRMLEIWQKAVPVRVGVSPMAGTIVLPLIYNELKDTYPDMLFQIEVNSTVALTEGLADGSYDVMFALCFEEPASEFRCSKLLSSRMVLQTWQGNPLSERDTISVADLDGIPLVLPDHHYSFSKALKNLLEEAQVQPEILVESEDISFFSCFIKNKIGSGFSTEYMKILYPDFIGVPLEPALEADVYMIWPRDKVTSRSTQTVIDFFEKEFCQKQLIGEDILDLLRGWETR